MVWGPSEVVVVTCILLSMTLQSQMVRGTDPSKTCLFNETCVLPCTFQAASEEVIHWLLDSVAAHSYYLGGDQLDLVAAQFRGRTSLFHDQIPKGNASLQLTEVKLQDQGRYKCYASTVNGNKESFIKLIVEAPVRSVDIQLSGDNITCSSRGIYPLPELTWSTKHPAHNHTHHEIDLQGLFSISGSLLMTGDTTDVDYTCSVSTHVRTRTATWRRQAPVQFSSSDNSALIHCSVPDSDSSPRNFNLTWTFDHSEPILAYTSTSASQPENPQVQERWRDQVQNVSESGSLRIHSLTRAHQGTYTCELSMAGNTYVALTDLKMQRWHWLIIAVVIAVLILVGILGGLYMYLKQRGSQSQHTKPVEEGTEMQTDRDILAKTDPCEKSPLTSEHNKDIPAKNGQCEDSPIPDDPNG